jgi:hypothetical protein
MMMPFSRDQRRANGAEEIGYVPVAGQLKLSKSVIETK